MIKEVNGAKALNAYFAQRVKVFAINASKSVDVIFLSYAIFSHHFAKPDNANTFLFFMTGGWKNWRDKDYIKYVYSECL